MVLWDRGCSGASFSRDEYATCEPSRTVKTPPPVRASIWPFRLGGCRICSLPGKGCACFALVWMVRRTGVAATSRVQNWDTGRQNWRNSFLVAMSEPVCVLCICEVAKAWLKRDIVVGVCPMCCVCSAVTRTTRAQICHGVSYHVTAEGRRFVDAASKRLCCNLHGLP